MARASYTAKRSLMSGVNENDSITYDFELSVIDRQAKPTRKTQIALGGAQETLRERTEMFWNVTTVPVLESDIENFRQFLDSVDGGETFLFDPYGTLAAPVQVMACTLSSKGYTERRVSHRWLSVSFQVRQN